MNVIYVYGTYLKTLHYFLAGSLNDAYPLALFYAFGRVMRRIVLILYRQVRNVSVDVFRGCHSATLIAEPGFCL